MSAIRAYCRLKPDIASGPKSAPEADLGGTLVQSGEDISARYGHRGRRQAFEPGISSIARKHIWTKNQMSKALRE
jgi:hypothetical protein